MTHDTPAKGLCPPDICPPNRVPYRYRFLERFARKSPGEPQEAITEVSLSIGFSSGLAKKPIPVRNRVLPPEELRGMSHASSAARSTARERQEIFARYWYTQQGLSIILVTARVNTTCLKHEN